MSDIDESLVTQRNSKRRRLVVYSDSETDGIDDTYLDCSPTETNVSDNETNEVDEPNNSQILDEDDEQQIAEDEDDAQQIAQDEEDAHQVGEDDNDLQQVAAVADDDTEIIAPEDDIEQDDEPPSLAEPVILATNSNNRCYLVTYSQADKSKYPTREDFGEACADAFGGVGRVVQYACCEEPHEGDGIHYHVSIKLRNGQKWFHAKQYFEDRGVVVNFGRPPKGACMYAWIYRYFYIRLIQK